MPAPKTPNTGPAHAGRSLAAAKRRIERAAELLRNAGWTVVPPDPATRDREDGHTPDGRAAVFADHREALRIEETR